MKKERKTKQLSDWEKEFDKAFPTGGSAYFNVNPLADEVRAFIRKALTKQRKELLDSLRMKTKDAKLAEILEWLYVMDNEFPDKYSWRKGLISKLKEIL